mmetsp:Transcript_13777/g.17979  ORF Transcript_13777/g.17979 Transcript_13777/m.17979 type:complete len:327 (+) Transcript_13777:132-1112(+)
MRRIHNNINLILRHHSANTPSKKNKPPLYGMAMMVLGAIIGDIAGSTYERDNCKHLDKIKLFAKRSRFTDDSVLTMATADYLMRTRKKEDTNTSYTQVYKEWGQRFPRAGYGYSFRNWLNDNNENPKPYNSWGNGSAMRVSPIAWVANDLEWAMEEAKKSAEVTHNHPEGIKGAQAVAAAIYLARTGKTKEEIRNFVQTEFGYNLHRTVDEIRPSYEFEVSCQKSVPEAIISFLDSENFEDAIRLAISLGGDSDTIACISGSIAHAFYGSIPEYMTTYCRNLLGKEETKVLETLDEFCEQFVINGAADELLLHDGNNQDEEVTLAK